MSDKNPHCAFNTEGVERWGTLNSSDLEIGDLQKIRSNTDEKLQPWKIWKEKALGMHDDHGNRPWASWTFDSDNPRSKPWGQWMKIEWIRAGGMPGAAPSQNHQGG